MPSSAGPSPSQLPDFGVGEQLYVPGALYAIHQVAGHALAEVVAPDDQVNLAGAAGEKDRRLARRVAATHDSDLVPRAHLRLGLGGGVVDAQALELFESRNVGAPVAGTGGDDYAASPDFSTLEKPYSVVASFLSRVHASWGTVVRAPNLSAWTIARLASSEPERPAGKPR